MKKRELVLHKSGCSVSGRRGLCCRASLPEMVWPEEMKKACSVAGEKLGAEQRRGRKTGREAEAQETVSYLLFLCDCTAPIPCLFKCMY